MELSDISEDEEINSNRFKDPLTDMEMQNLLEKDIPEKTKKSISWAFNLIEQW